MNIKKATIQNFKSIEHVEIDFSNDCKLFVGISECGKTNLLLALRTLDKSFPVNKTYIKEGTKTTDESYVEFTLTFNKEEKEDFMKLMKKNIFSSKMDNIVQMDKKNISLTSFMNFDICYVVDIRDNSRKYLYYESENNEDYTLNLNYMFINSSSWPINIINKKNNETVQVNKKSIFNKNDYEVSESYIENINSIEELYDFLHDEMLHFSKTLQLPKTLFWEYNEKNILPAEVDIASFIENPNSNIPLYYIFKLSNIDDISSQYKECKEMSESTFQNLLDEISNNLNSYLKSVWKSMPKVSIHLEEYVDTIRIRIVDSKNKYLLKNRSDGFKRLLTFMIMLSIKSKNNLLNNNLILIDEPDAKIDIPGQEYLMKELIKIGKNNYVFYSTHSTSMIDTEYIPRHYIVKKENESTYIEVASEDNYENAATLYRALGMQVYKIINPNNIVFEGWTDSYLFNRIIKSKGFPQKEYKNVGITHVGGAKNFKNFARYWGLLSRNYIIISDNDEPAIREKNIFLEENYSGKWFTYNDLVESKTINTVEDFLTDDFIKDITDSYTKANNFSIPMNYEKLKNSFKMTVIEEWINSNIIAKDDIKKETKKFKQKLFNSITPKSIDKDLYKEFLNNLSAIINSKDNK